MLEQETGSGTEAAFQTLVAISRWQSAHAPTRRAVIQTYTIALRLHRGKDVYNDPPEAPVSA